MQCKILKTQIAIVTKVKTIDAVFGNVSTNRVKNNIESKNRIDIICDFESQNITLVLE